jgi:hypothetical protein
MKQVIAIVGFVLLIGLVGRMDYADAQRSAEIDAQNKREVIKEWQVRCFNGDIFDEQICKAVLNERK